jgi:putative aldouronate transport system permease protein
MLLLRNLFVNASIGYTLQGQDIFNEARMTPISFRMAITVIGTIPILCVYPFLQKHFTKGMYVGAVKG